MFLVMIQQILLTEEMTLQYQEYLKDKSVAIVGSSLHLIGKKEGSIIDSHDVVVRLNNSSFVPSELREDLGSRFDVGYFWHPIMRYNSEQESFSKNMKYAYLGKNRHHKFNLAKVSPKADQAWLKEQNIPCEKMDHWLHLCCLECKVSPHSGMAAIYHLLKQPLKALYIVGFSFYREGAIEIGIDEYKVSIDVECKKARDFWELHGKLPTQLPHNSVVEEEVFFKWVANDPRIKLDSYLSNFAS